MNRKISKSLALCLAQVKHVANSAAQVKSPTKANDTSHRKWSLALLFTKKHKSNCA
jgi:hypothetical protein